MDYSVDIVPIETIVGRVARDQIFPLGRYTHIGANLPEITEQYADDFLTSIAQEQAPPLTITLDSSGVVVSGQHHLSILVGALLHPDERHNWVELPKFLDTMVVTDIGEPSGPTVWSSYEPAGHAVTWLPVNYIPRTAAWTSWCETLGNSQLITAREARKVLSEANRIARMFMDYRVVLIRAGRNVSGSRLAELMAARGQH